MSYVEASEFLESYFLIIPIFAFTYSFGVELTIFSTYSDWYVKEILGVMIDGTIHDRTYRTYSDNFCRD